MDEHVHEWKKWHPWCATYRCVHPGCYKNMPSDEVERRLNATERLSAEWARDAIIALEDILVEDAGIFGALQSYANILEGK